MKINKLTPEILSRSFGTKFFLFLFLGLSICFTSCDESSVVGLDVQPPNDLLNVNSQDTTTLVTRSIHEDSLRTDEQLIFTAAAMIGKYNDPVFGEATASLYTQVALFSNLTSTSFGASPVCDSIVLSLVYSPAYYGKKERKQQTITVDQLSEAIPNGEKYSNKTLLHPTNLASYNFIPRPTDSVIILSVRSKPQLRIPLNLSFGTSLINELLTGTGLTSGPNFLNYMKGFYITTEGTTGLNSGEGNILNFKMAESRMTLYYHNSTTDSLKYDFGLGGVARYSYFSHNFTSADLNLTSQLGGTSPAQNDMIFLQSMSGVKAKIEMPTIMHWLDSGAVAINKAELVIKVDVNATNQQDSIYPEPTALVVFGIADDGKYTLLDDGKEGSNYFGGIYNAATKEYRFNIARYIQQVLTGKSKNNGLMLLASSGAINANRVVIGGGKNTSPYQMKLQITYTKLH